MKKHLPKIIVVSLFWIFLSAGLAVAGEAQWQIGWREDGTLQEKVILSKQLNVKWVDSGWQLSTTGGQQTFTRTVKNWREYNSLHDKLPLEVNQSNYIVCDLTEFKASRQVSNESLYAKLAGTDSMKLQIEVPGMIRNSSADQTSQNLVSWNIEKPGQPLNSAFALQTITFDGWMLGISILTLGVIIMFIFFVGRMRKVDRIIEETYSLDNIKIDEDDLD